MNAVYSFSGRIGVTGPGSAPIRIGLFLIAGTLLLGISATSVGRNQSVSQPSDGHQAAMARSSFVSSRHSTTICQKGTAKKQLVDNVGNPSVIRKSGDKPSARLSTNNVILDNNPPQTDDLEDLDAYVADRLANHPTVASINEASRQAEADWSTQLDHWKKTCHWQEEKTQKLYLSE